MYPFEIILYVENQNISKNFYKNILEINPRLDVPGMTEFEINSGCILGLMPYKNIKVIIPQSFSKFFLDSNIPSCELYIITNEIDRKIKLAIENGAKILSPFEMRNWGHEVVYFSDPDSHILAFAKIATKD
jgi:uncharacterized glyoxalase superfamily protein PhnB